MPEIRSASDMRLVVLGNITLHLRIRESHTSFTFGALDKLAVPVQLGTTSID